MSTSFEIPNRFFSQNDSLKHVPACIHLTYLKRSPEKTLYDWQINHINSRRLRKIAAKN